MNFHCPGARKWSSTRPTPTPRSKEKGVEFLGDLFKLAGEVVYIIVLDDHNKVKASRALRSCRKSRKSRRSAA